MVARLSCGLGLIGGGLRFVETELWIVDCGACGLCSGSWII